MTRSLPYLFLVGGTLLLTSCAAPQFPEASGPVFTEEAKANIVIRYYSEKVNRVLKPMQRDGPFLETMDKSTVLDLAKRQPGRDLAVVVLIRYNALDSIKQQWVEHLTGLGYQRVVFLQGDGVKINGLHILDNPGHLTGHPEVAQHPAG